MIAAARNSFHEWRAAQNPAYMARPPNIACVRFSVQQTIFLLPRSRKVCNSAGTFWRYARFACDFGATWPSTRRREQSLTRSTARFEEVLPVKSHVFKQETSY